ncbi:MAG: glycosyltransferase [Deltaproteobacteria bacterium]|nr:glycosyltransferase [Deltaproteobacteria bacterium]
MSSSAPAPKTAWIFCPVFLDVESFLILRERLLAAVRSVERLRGAAVRFVAIDDTGGTDGELERLSAFTDVTVLSTPFNLGHQRAIVFGLRKLSRQLADDDLVVTLDADGEDRPEDLPRMLAPLLSDGANLKRVVLARRTKRKESPVFKLMYLGFKLLFHTLTGIVIRTGNFAAHRGWLTRNVLFHPHFDLCYSSSLISLSLDVAYVPCERGKRYAGQSRMNYMKLMIHGIRMLMPFLDRISVRALIGFSATFALGLLAAATVLAGKLTHCFPVPHWAPLAVIITLALSFIALGNFVVLFAIFSQTQGLSLHDLDRV